MAKKLLAFLLVLTVFCALASPVLAQQPAEEEFSTSIDANMDAGEEIDELLSYEDENPLPAEETQPDPEPGHSPAGGTVLNPDFGRANRDSLEPLRISPSGSAYLQGIDSTANNNYGTAETLMVRESYPTDGYVRRSLLQFDIANVNPSEAESVVLRLYITSQQRKSENGGIWDDKDFAIDIWATKFTGWSDSSITWNQARNAANLGMPEHISDAAQAQRENETRIVYDADKAVKLGEFNFKTLEQGVNGGQGWIEADITDAFKALGSDLNTLSLMLIGQVNDEIIINIASSRHSDTTLVPHLEVVGGQTEPPEPPELPANQQKVDVQEDTFLFANTPAAPNGSAEWLQVKELEAGYTRRTLFKLDMSEVDASKKPESIVLRMFVGQMEAGTWNNKSFEIDVWATEYTGWSEDTITWNLAREATGLRMPDIASPTPKNEAEAHIDYPDGAFKLGSIKFRSIDVAANFGWLEADLTDALKDYPGSELSLMLIGQVNTSVRVFIASKEQNDPAVHPHLLYTYPEFDIYLPFEDSLENLGDKGELAVPSGETEYVEGVYGRGIRLDGENYLDLGLNPIDYSQNFSLAFWYKHEGNTSKDPALFSNKDWDSGGNNGLAVTLQEASNLRLNTKPASGTRNDTGLGTAEDNWNHFAFTFDIDTETITIYKNGVVHATVDDAGTLAGGLATTLNTYLGQSAKGGGLYQTTADALAGYYDEFILAQKLISPERIAALATDPYPNRQEYDMMRERWVERLTGGERLDLDDTHIKAYVDDLDARANALWQTLNRDTGRTRLWPWAASGTEAGSNPTARSADMTTQFRNILALSQAWATEGTELYEDPDVLETILDCLTFMTGSGTYRFHGSAWTGNWWEWQIGTPQALVDILMILRDEIPQVDINRYCDIISVYAYDPRVQINNATGSFANLTDIAISVLGVGILSQNDSKVEMVVSRMPYVMGRVTSGEGFYPDGSFRYHGSLAYTASYGNETIKGVGRIVNILSGTPWDIPADDLEIFYENVANAFLPTVVDGKMMLNLGGRSITRYRPGGMELSAGNGTMANLMVLAYHAPEKYTDQYLSAVKYWLGKGWDHFDYMANVRDLEALLNYKEILDDSSISPVAPLAGTHMYNSMGRAVGAFGGYTTAISMYSNRIANFEYGTGTGENARGWHTGSGVVYIYDADMSQYTEPFYPTMDWYRLPGTTIDTRTQANGAGQGKTSGQSWVGGTHNGDIAAVGMKYDVAHLNLGMDTKATKSWFLLDGRIVALGNGISGTTSASIETVVENRMLNEDASNSILLNGRTLGTNLSGQSLDAGAWAHLEGSVAGADIGYVFPDGAQGVYAARDARTGTYPEIDASQTHADSYTASYFKLGINHGTSVSDDSYYYIMLPGSSATETEAYAAGGDIEVVAFDGDVHAIRSAADNALMMNVWAASGATVEGYTVSKAASVILQNNGEEITLSLNNPNQNGGVITVTLPYSIEEVLGSSYNSRVTAAAGGNTIAIDTSSPLLGDTVTVSFTADVTPSGILLNKDTLALEEGQTATLTATLLPEGATAEITWTSSNETVADVVNGLVTAVAPGTATITASVGSLSATCEVTVTGDIVPTGILLDRETLALEEGQTATLTATLLPEGATAEITWTSSNEAVAGVVKGLVTAVAPGTATITASAGSLSATCEVTVSAAALESISVARLPDKVEYELGEDLHTAGLQILAHYSNGRTELVTGYSISGYDKNASGPQTILVTYEGKTTTFDVFVNQAGVPTVTGIEITTPPIKLEYTAGEQLNLTGLVVTASYSDGNTAPVTGYGVSGFDTTKTGKQTITVRYLEFTATFDVQVRPAEKAKEYTVTSGNNGIYSGGNALVLQVNGDLADFTGVRVAGKTLNRDVDYTVQQGSVIISLLPAWLNTLENGSYTVEILFTDGTASASIRVALPDTAGGNQTTDSGSAGQPVGTAAATGDKNARVILWMLVAICAAAMLPAALRRKMKNHI